MTIFRNASTVRLANRRAGLTLIEIMASVLVLSIGLVGVLAAIPFGGFRMAQMQEADNSSSLGRNAARLMKANDWANPQNWWNKVPQTGSQAFTDDRAIYASGNFNLSCPFFVDPIGKSTGVYTPELFFATPVGGYAAYFTRVDPTLAATPLAAVRVERNFYLQDDFFYGYNDSEDETEFRPQLETEADLVTNAGAIPAFSGRYTWFATVAPHASSDPFYNCRPSDITAADYDAVVVKDRIVGDEKAFTATVEGSGYQGGAITLDLTSGVNAENVGVADLDRQRVVEQLESTRYIMLIGEDDVPVDGAFRAFAKWYKIANSSVVASDAADFPTTLRLTLIGRDVPRTWATGNKTVTALFFPGVVGVYSGTTTF